jgi:hypothetical protein
MKMGLERHLPCYLLFTVLSHGVLVQHSEQFLIFEGETFISLKEVVAFHSARIILSAGLAVDSILEGGIR